MTRSAKMRVPVEYLALLTGGPTRNNPQRKPRDDRQPIPDVGASVRDGGVRLGRGYEATRFCFRVVGPYADFDSAPKRHKPSREPVDGHALHPPAHHLG